LLGCRSPARRASGLLAPIASPRRTSSGDPVYGERVIANVAKHSPVVAVARHPLVAVALVRSGTLRTTALGECDRPVIGAVPQSRSAEFGRIRSSAATQIGPIPDDRFVASGLSI
jgi:hypothetical protein